MKRAFPLIGSNVLGTLRNWSAQLSGINFLTPDDVPSTPRVYMAVWTAGSPDRIRFTSNQTTLTPIQELQTWVEVPEGQSVRIDGWLVWAPVTATDRMGLGVRRDSTDIIPSFGTFQAPSVHGTYVGADDTAPVMWFDREPGKGTHIYTLSWCNLDGARELAFRGACLIMTVADYK